MKQNRRTYIGLGIVFVASSICAVLLPIEDLFKGIAAMPAVGSLFFSLLQIFRDQAAYEKQLELQRSRQFFDLAVTSHMANTAFDRHVEFCEKYMREVHETFRTLMQDGPTKQATEHANKLYGLRLDYAAWVTDQMGEQLDCFKSALLGLGARTRYIETTGGRPRDATHYSRAIKESYDMWEGLLAELLKKESAPKTSITVEKTKTKIREILGIDELTRIRQWVISQATKSIEGDA